MVITVKRGAGKAKIKDLMSKLVKAKKIVGIDAYKYCGIIKLQESPNEIQKSLRIEWD